MLTPAAAAGQFNATAVNVTPVVSPFGVSFSSDFGFGFNPVPDAIRVVEEENLNFRFSPNSGNSLGLDGNLNPGDPRIVAADYTNSFDGATSTTLYDIDSGSDRLFTQGSVGGTPVSPNTGTLFDVGPLGVDTTDNAGLDIAQASGTAYASFELAGSPGSSVLHTLDLSTGAATPVGTIAGGMPLEPVRGPGLGAAALVRHGGEEEQRPGADPGHAHGTGEPHGYRRVFPVQGRRQDADVRARRLPGEHHGADDRRNVTITLSGERERDPRAAVIDQRGRVDDTAPAPQPSPGPDIDTTAPEPRQGRAEAEGVARALLVQRGVLRARPCGGAARRSARRPTASTAPAPAGCGSA